MIYFYCPLHDKKLEQKLEQRIVKTAKPGALILGNLKQARELWGAAEGDRSEVLEHLWDKVIYRKKGQVGV